MKDWDNFHDYAEARKYSKKWYHLVQGHKEELAVVANLRQQRAEKARVDRENRAALEKARRLRQAKEQEAARIEAELERARAEEKAALSRGKPAPGPEKSPAKEVRPNRQKSCQRSRQRSVSRRRPSRDRQPVRSFIQEEVVRPPRALSSGRQSPGEPRTPRQPREPRRCFFSGHPNVRNPATCPGAQNHDPLNPYYYRQQYQKKH